ncbi:MAG: hypothetical protein ABJZ55_05780, partial [Fuerstiella sp.]
SDLLSPKPLMPASVRGYFKIAQEYLGYRNSRQQSLASTLPADTIHLDASFCNEITINCSVNSLEKMDGPG